MSEVYRLVRVRAKDFLDLLLWRYYEWRWGDKIDGTGNLWCPRCFRSVVRDTPIVPLLVLEIDSVPCWNCWRNK